jgi:hypothetical protein
MQMMNANNHCELQSTTATLQVLAGSRNRLGLCALAFLWKPVSSPESRRDHHARVPWRHLHWRQHVDSCLSYDHPISRCWSVGLMACWPLHAQVRAVVLQPGLLPLPRQCSNSSCGPRGCGCFGSCCGVLANRTHYQRQPVCSPRCGCCGAR